MFVSGIAADESKAVHRFHDLSRPSEVYFAGGRESLARPVLQSSESFVGVVRLAGLMVFAADDECLVLAIRCQPHIMIRIEGIPIQTLVNASWHPHTYYISPIGGLLGMDRDPIVDWRIRRHDDRVCGNSRTFTCLDLTRRAVGEAVGLGLVKDSSSFRFNRARQGVQIFQWMKLRLARESQTRPRVEIRQWGAR